MPTCPSCKAQTPDDAVFCPRCGRRLAPASSAAAAAPSVDDGRGKAVGLGFLGVVALLLIYAVASNLSGGGSAPTPQPTGIAEAAPVATSIPTTIPPTSPPAPPTNTPEPTATSTKAPTVAPTTEPTKAPVPTSAQKPVAPQVHKIGDEVAVGGHRVKLVSVKPGPVIYAEILTVNSDGASVFKQYYGCFYAQDESWNQLKRVYPEGYSGWYQGDIRPGDKLKGAVAFTSGATAGHPRLYYNGCDGSQNTSPVVFALTTDDDGNPWPIPDLSKAIPGTNAKYGVSDLVSLDRFFVQLVAAKNTGNEISATVFIYNASAKPFYVSHMNSFEVKDADGDQATYDIRAGSAQAYGEIEGFVAPNQGLAGTLVHKFASQPVGDIVLTYKAGTYPEKYVSFVIR